MDTSPNVCESCGSQLPEGVKFCLQCGAPVPEKHPEAAQVYEPQPPPSESEQSKPVARPEQPAYTPPPQPAPAYTPPPPTQTSQPASKGRLPCLIIAGVVLLGLICLGALAAGAYLFFFPLNSNRSGGSVEVTTEVVQEPAGAYITATTIYDPFDDNSLGWEQDSASDLTTAVENGAFSIYTNTPSTYFWIYPPVDFNPTVIEYDAWVDSSTSTQDFGTYGVMCNFQDSNNFTYVEVDPNDGSVYFARFVDDEEISLRDQSWTESANLKPSAGQINHIKVECHPDSLSLSVNGGLEDQVSIDPPGTAGSSGILIGTWDTLDPNGYKVFFDNFLGTVSP